MYGLTEKQREIYLFLINFLLKNHHLPTFREIAAKFSFTEKAAFDHIHALEKKRYIDRIYKGGKYFLPKIKLQYINIE